MRIALVLGAAALALAACASITRGTTQTVTVNTEPQGARCELVREGAVIAVVDPTPGTVNVDRDSDDIRITCTRAGHEHAEHVLVSETEEMTAGNVLAGGAIGLAIDAGTGAMNRYAPDVVIVMRRDGRAPAPRR